MVTAAMARACKRHIVMECLGRFRIIELYKNLTWKSSNRPKQKQNAMQAFVGREQVKPKFPSPRPAVRVAHQDAPIYSRSLTRKEVCKIPKRLDAKETARRPAPMSIISDDDAHDWSMGHGASGLAQLLLQHVDELFAEEPHQANRMDLIHGIILPIDLELEFPSASEEVRSNVRRLASHLTALTA